MPSIFCILILKFLFWSVSYSSKGHNVTGHDNCITRHDNKRTLFLTCMVRNFHLPVTFRHANSKTVVQCKIKSELQCSPKEKKISINRFNHTVTLVLEEDKFVQNYDGDWFCIQGQSTQKTTVSISQGIIIDTWVELRGTAPSSGNGEKTVLLLECSSCRQPQGLYAEFLENDVTAGSVHQDKNGNCIFNQSACPPVKCNCLKTANFFSFQLEVKNAQMLVNYSCEMHFTDSNRNGIFSITASKNFTGENFTVRENVTNIIRNYTHVINIPQPTTIKANVAAIVLPIVGCSCLIFILIISIWYFHHKKKSDQTDKKAIEEICLLPKGRSTNPFESLVNCKSCEKETPNKGADILCFDCRQYFCKQCFGFHEKTCDLSSHEKVDIDKVPHCFDISLFFCSEEGHKASPLNFHCKNHHELCCTSCKNSTHSNCHTNRIQDCCADKVSKLLIKHMSEHNSLKEKLLFNERYLNNSLDTLKMQLNLIKKQMESFNNTETFQLQQNNPQTDDNKCTTHISKKDDIISQLDKEGTKLSNETQEWLGTNHRVQDYIENQKLVLDFLSEYGNKSFMYIAIKSFGKKLSPITTEIENAIKSLYTLEVKMKIKNRMITVVRKDLTTSKFTFPSINCFLRHSVTRSSGTQPQSKLIDEQESDTSM